MSVAIDVLDPRVDPEPADWARFCQTQQLILNWDYSLLRIESTPAGSPTLLVTVRVNGELVAAVVALISSYGSGTRPKPGRVRGFATVTPRWVEVHHRWLSGYPAWAFAEHLDTDARRSILRLVERALCRTVGLGCLGVAYRVVRQDELSMVTGFGRVVRKGVTCAELENSFTTLDDWYLSLGKKRRYAVRGRARKIAADPDLTIEFGPARTELAGTELAPFIDNHRDTYGRSKLDARGKQTPAGVEALVHRPDVYTLTYRNKTGRLIGLATLLDHHSHPSYQHWATLRPEDGGQQHLYFDSYPRLIQHVIDTGAKQLNAGRGYADLKESLGFAGHELYGVVVPRPVAG